MLDRDARRLLVSARRLLLDLPDRLLCPCLALNGHERSCVIGRRERLLERIEEALVRV